MKRADKIFIAVMATLMFFISGGIACTYSSGLNLVLVGALGFLIFITSGYAACTYSMRKTEKQRVK